MRLGDRHRREDRLVAVESPQKASFLLRSSGGRYCRSAKAAAGGAQVESGVAPGKRFDIVCQALVVLPRCPVVTRRTGGHGQSAGGPQRGVHEVDVVPRALVFVLVVVAGGRPHHLGRDCLNQRDRFADRLGGFETNHLRPRSRLTPWPARGKCTRPERLASSVRPDVPECTRARRGFAPPDR